MSLLSVERLESERVAVLTMAYKAENRFNPDLLAEMMAALDELEKDRKVGALVLTGADPKFFCNGLDLEWLLAHVGDVPAILAYLGQVNAMYRRWTLYPKPTIAALNGHTFAGGLFLAAHLDFRLMRQDRGWICLPEVDINIPLLPAMIAICQATMTPAGFRKLYYTGRRFSGPEAVEMGFVDGLHGAEDLLPQSIAFAAELAKKRTRTYAEMKRRNRAFVADLIDNEDPKHYLSTLSFSMG